jgi:hypothetical protein
LGVEVGVNVGVPSSTGLVTGGDWVTGGRGDGEGRKVAEGGIAVKVAVGGSVSDKDSLRSVISGLTSTPTDFIWVAVVEQALEMITPRTKHKHRKTENPVNRIVIQLKGDKS